MWIYVLGSTDGARIKIGKTAGPLWKRIDRVNGEQMSDDRYVQLVAVRSEARGETHAQDAFEEHRLPLGRKKEYYRAAEPLIEWVLWLRQQWFVSFEDSDTEAEIPEVHPDDWLPKPGRREPRPPTDPNKLIGDSTQFSGPLAGTAWDWMPDLTSSFQDYFTPPELVQAAAEAMGGIDLDAASHWIANRRLREAGVIIGDYFHVNRSAFTHDWLSAVWLNPPYKNNDPWFKRALAMMDAGRTTQLCMISPVYVFTTAIARPIMARASATVLLSPTPQFFNPADAMKTGTNLPHAVVYWGHRRGEFLDAFAPFGIRCILEP